MKKGAAILLIFYSMVMLSYGALEMTHDLLHYLATHHHTRLHDHHHGHHHHFNDHHHTTVDHHHPEGGQMELPSLISSFLFIESKPVFSFSAALTGKVCHRSMLHLQPVDYYPLTPPPQEKKSLQSSGLSF